MINRNIESILVGLAKSYPVVTLTGPRQSGKTTLCRKAFPTKRYAGHGMPIYPRDSSNLPNCTSWDSKPRSMQIVIRCGETCLKI